MSAKSDSELAAEVIAAVAVRMAEIDSLRADLAQKDGQIAALLRENASLKEANEIDLGEKTPLLVQIAALTAKLEAAQAAIDTLLDSLPDSVHADDCWTWCWDALDGDAQDRVKAAREKAVAAKRAAHEAGKEMK